MKYTAQIMEFLTKTHWLGNTLRAYLVCLCIILGGFVVLRVLHRQVLRRLQRWAEKTPGQFDDMLVMLVQKNVMPSLLALLLYHALNDLHLQHSFKRALDVMLTAVLAWQGVQITITFANELLRGYWRSTSEERTAERERSMNGIITILKVVVWVLAGVLALDNLGIKVSAFMAGLGITGIAVALAAQTVLGDLFAYFVIFFDKPFEVGHFIAVEGTLGEVEHIGLKTTRLKSLSGEQVVISNKHLTDAKVQNYRRMLRRRAVFSFEVEYSTSDEVLRAIPGTVKGIIQGQEKATFDRCHMMAFADSGLRYEVVFYIEAPDYNTYMDIQQEIQFQLKTEVEKLGTGFAFPTRTLHIASHAAPSSGTSASG